MGWVATCYDGGLDGYHGRQVLGVVHAASI
jgi:hypothetical protein